MANERVDGDSSRIERVVSPGTETLLLIRVAPRATCTLFHSDIPERTLRLDADDQGIVRIHAKAPAGTAPIELQLQCVDEAERMTTYTIEVRSDPAAAAEAEGRRVPASEEVVQPPLQGDPMALTNSELVSRGFPPRPDPATAPALYARWLRTVSRPYTRVSTRTVGRPDVSFAGSRRERSAEASSTLSLAPFTPQPVAPLPSGPRELPPRLMSPTLPLPPPIVASLFNSNSSTWSGAYYTNPVAQFFWIQADWNVPGVYGTSDSPFYSAVAEWVGLDNSGTDLYQSGTDSECIVFFGWTFTNYWMWIEMLPFAPWAVTNFPISPGDSISIDIFVADQNGNTWFVNNDEGNGGLTAADNSVWFMLYNNTNGSSFWGTLPTAPTAVDGVSSTGYTGSTAEFILERPTVNGSPAPLASFGFAIMQSCWYGDSEYGDRPWRLGPAGSSPFDATLTYLNMLNPATNDLLALPFNFPDPTSPGGVEILWLWINYE
jgi:hypothetical protein